MCRIDKKLHLCDRMDEYSSDESAKYSTMYNKIFQQARLPDDKAPMVRSCTTAEICENLYCFIYMLDDYIVFGYDEKQKKWLYGAHPSDISSGKVHMMKPEQIIKAFMDMKDHPDQETQNPLLKQMKEFNTPASWTNMMHTVGAAQAALKKNNDLCNDIVPYIHPPPDTPHENRQRMRAWAPLKIEDFRRPKAKTIVAFSTKTADVSWLQAMDGQRILSHGFMHSTIHLIKTRA
jgi:hypothetical protein